VGDKIGTRRMERYIKFTVLGCIVVATVIAIILCIQYVTQQTTEERRYCYNWRTKLESEKDTALAEPFSSEWNAWHKDLEYYHKECDKFGTDEG
jgi:hypothetical protein